MGIGKIKASVQNLLNARLKFGEYNTSINNLRRLYREEQNGNETIFYDKKNHQIAVCQGRTGTCDFFGTYIDYNIYDCNTDRLYSTKEFETSPEDIKFAQLYCDGYMIEDNGNGIVDENDLIYLDSIYLDPDHSYESITIKDFLNQEDEQSQK